MEKIIDNPSFVGNFLIPNEAHIHVCVQSMDIILQTFISRHDIFIFGLSIAYNIMQI
jgi:hypothetical protein